MARPIGVIQNSGPLINLLRTLGVNRPPTPFTLDGDVVPVILVDSAVSFVASPTPPYGVTDIFTAGILTAPAIGALFADTGALPVGSYTVQIVFFLEVGGMQYDIQWRDAPNAANLWLQRLSLNSTGGSPRWGTLTTRLEIQNANERFRVVAASTGGAGEDSQATILARL